MKTATILIAACVGLTLTGCVPSLNPLYTEKDLIYEPALLGVWAEKEDSKDTWEFQKGGEKAYRLVVTDDDGKRGEFKAHLLKLDKTMFLDLHPDPAALNETGRSDFYKSHFLPVHTFAKVTQIEPTLQMAFFNPDWLKKLLEGDPKAIRHEKVEDGVLLTAPTADLQKFVLKHSNTKDAFGDEPSNLKKIRVPHAKVGEK